MSEITETIQDFVNPKALRSEVVEVAAQKPRAVARLASRLAREAFQQAWKGNVSVGRGGVTLRGDAPDKLMAAAGVPENHSFRGGKFRGHFPFVGETEKQESPAVQPKAQVHFFEEPPAPPLVGVEPNPGPPKSQKKHKEKKSHSKKKHKQDKVKAPVATGRRAYDERPIFTTLPNGGTRIHHTEYVTDFVSTTSGYSAIKHVVNPFNTVLFPWLSSLARSYERYRFTSLSFHYYQECPTSMPGSIMMMFDVDPTDGIPLTKQEFLTHDNKARGSAWLSTSLKVNKSTLNRLKSWYLRRSNATTAGLALSDLDVGNFFFGSYGVNANTLMGELSVEYTIELLNPGESNGFVSQSISAVGPAGTFAATQIFGSNAATRSYTGDLLTYVMSTGSSLGSYLYYSKTGLYMTFIEVQGSSFDATSGIYVASSNQVTSRAGATGKTASSSSYLTYFGIWEVTQANGWWFPSITGPAANITSTKVYVSQINPAILTDLPTPFPTFSSQYSSSLASVVSQSTLLGAPLQSGAVAVPAQHNEETPVILPAVSSPEPEDDKEREFVAQQLAMYRFGSARATPGAGV